MIYEKIKNKYFGMKAKIESNTKEPDNILYGHDLSVWNYLGIGEISFGENDDILYKAQVFYFEDKLIPENRSIHLVCQEKARNSFINNHEYYITCVVPWLAGEDQKFSFINFRPSNYLEKYMQETYSEKWNDSTKCWTKIQTRKKINRKTKRK